MPPSSVPEVVESTLILLVGKQIPVTGGFSYGNMADLRSTVHRYASEQPVTALAGGFPSNLFEMDQINNAYPVVSDIVAGMYFPNYLQLVLTYP